MYNYGKKFIENELSQSASHKLLFGLMKERVMWV